MNLKEVTYFLGWTREKVEIAIVEGIATPATNKITKLAASKLETDYDIREEDVDVFIAAFEADAPGRYPPILVRRELLIESGYRCAICKSDAPPRFHHIVDWANLKHHDVAQMLAVCGSCHDKIGQGIIDTKAQKIVKQRLLRLNSQVTVETINSTKSSENPGALEKQISSSETESSKSTLLARMGLEGDEFVIVDKFNDTPANWFHGDRFTTAFPGVRGISEIQNPAEAVERLSILLRAPLKWVWQDGDDYTAAASPLWWWRGLGNMPIDHYSVTSANEILLDCQELPIRRVAAVNMRGYWQSFVYVETEAKPPIGIYEKPSERSSKWLEERGYSDEEYGLYEGRAITRAEFDDGAAMIDGKPCKTKGAQLRVRYTSPYNFIIASQESPINNSKFELQFRQILNDMLKGKATVQDLANEFLKLPRRGDFDGYLS